MGSRVATCRRGRPKHRADSRAIRLTETRSRIRKIQVAEMWLQRPTTGVITGHVSTLALLPCAGSAGARARWRRALAVLVQAARDPG